MLREINMGENNNFKNSETFVVHGVHILPQKSFHTIVSSHLVKQVQGQNKTPANHYNKLKRGGCSFPAQFILKHLKFY